jgi:hypothetical protein
MTSKITKIRKKGQFQKGSTIEKSQGSEKFHRTQSVEWYHQCCTRQKRETVICNARSILEFEKKKKCKSFSFFVWSDQYRFFSSVETFARLRLKVSDKNTNTPQL